MSNIYDYQNKDEDARKLADDVALRKVLAHEELGGAEARREDAVAARHRAADLVGALPDDLGKVRRLRTVRVVLGCMGSKLVRTDNRFTGHNETHKPRRSMT